MKLFVFLLGAASAAFFLPAAHATPPVSGSLAGLKVGMDKDAAEAALTAAGASSARKKDADKKDADKKDADDDKDHADGTGDPDDAVPEVWTLKNSPKNSPYAQVVFAADDSAKVLWVTAFARPGQPVPFAQIGSLARAAASSPAFAVWNVISPQGSFREIARGQGGKAFVVSLLPLRSVDPNGAFSPQMLPKHIPTKSTSKPLPNTEKADTEKADTERPK